MTDYLTNADSIFVTDRSRVAAGVVIGDFDTVGAVYVLERAILDMFGTAMGQIGIYLGDECRATVQATGSVSAFAVIGGDGNLVNGIGVNGSDTTVLVNQGRISGECYGVYGGYVRNAGSISGGALGGTIGIGVRAMKLDNTGTVFANGDAVEASYVTNAGQIISDSIGVNYTRNVSNQGLIQGSVTAVRAAGLVLNAGTIIGEVGVELEGSSYDEIINSGQITGLNAHRAAIWVAEQENATTPTVVNNRGTITASTPTSYAIDLGSGDDWVGNSGRISGWVDLGGGNDHYLSDTGTTTGRVLLGTGNDVGSGGWGRDVIFGDDGNDILFGGENDDSLYGGAGSDQMTGGAGVDRMDGGTGDDVFFVDDARDRVLEAVGGGNDTVYAAVSFALQAGQEVEVLAIDRAAFTGLALTGNTFAQTITGDAGANRITGGGGADTLIGLGGDDTYVVTDATAVVVEGVNAGFDTVLTGVSHALADNVEALRTSNARGTGAIDLTGNGLDNELVGNNGANVLDGGAGADTMAGGLGDDTYYVDNAGDLVRDSGGNDGVIASVSYTLTGSIERLVLAADGLTGRGSAGANVLEGSSGDDVLAGRQGLDTLTGGLGANRFLFETGARAGDADLITDFASGEDVIALDDAVFRRIGGPGALDARFFTEGAATTRDHHILYDATTGTLAFDFDGSGTAYGAVVFATVTPGTVLTAADIVVV